MGSLDPVDLFDRAALAPADSVERHLLLVAAIASVIPPTLVVVGGAAVNVHTGKYQPTDIDLVGAVDASDRRLLVDHGFQWLGVGHRHMSYTFPDGEICLVEFPSSQLDGTRPPVWMEVQPGVGVWMVSVDDLMMDRLQQATEGSITTFEDAVTLARAVYEKADWEALASESESPANRAIGVPEVLARVLDEVS